MMALEPCSQPTRALKLAGTGQTPGKGSSSECAGGEPGPMQAKGCLVCLRVSMKRAPKSHLLELELVKIKQ